MIDIHSHILPKVDDGAVSFEEAIQIAKSAVNEGITTIIATPHHQNGKYINYKQSILEKVEELNLLLKKEDVPLSILPGQESRIHGDLLIELENDLILPLNHTNYVFIELPSGHVPRYTEQMLFDIQMKGLTPIIVHPERNSEIIENPDLLYKLVSKGALTQITASSLTGHFGKNIKKFTLQLIESQLTHFLASDVHSLKNRPFRLANGYGVLNHEFGSDAVYLFKENAELLIKNLTVYRMDPSRIKKKKFLGIF
ncbi:tyrosine-protein phosphatase [Metabacillus hrfriensis]|uniref:Tyrosine protein phosphatase n=1 Tax=Metabacillus hrfriensis TaxID=3048891 RepID=A0ACD4RAX2_9BACI|nr:CpsB/CapC family capsule biosynthesis tyrosine phosphatase [Metabacillus sp. CT-WN-B3]WHZ57599.1 tyrosine protein phosphatase [Metabacillus sp. CT-WN-B3]